jgi:hypothetical protein
MTQITLEWHDVKRHFVECVQDGKRWGATEIGPRLAALHTAPYAKDWRTEWEGGTGADTLGWLRDGFRSEEFEASADLVSVSRRSRVMWSEEDGDVDVGRLYGGYDDFYLSVAESDAKPGLKLEIDFAFAALVQPSTVRQYGAWIAGLIGSLEARGYDLEVTLIDRMTDLWENARGEQHVAMRVKRFGELSDFTSWSALFAPTGYRHVVFTALGMACDKVGKTLAAGLGTTLPNSEWGVRYDSEANVLTVMNDQRASGENACPTEYLTEMLTESGLI